MRSSDGAERPSSDEGEYTQFIVGFSGTRRANCRRAQFDRSNGKAASNFANVLHIELLTQEGEEIPESSTDVGVDKDIDVAIFFLARVELPGKAVRLNITMDEALVARIDRVAGNRSAFLAEAARERLRELAQG